MARSEHADQRPAPSRRRASGASSQEPPDAVAARLVVLADVATRGRGGPRRRAARAHEGRRSSSGVRWAPAAPLDDTASSRRRREHVAQRIPSPQRLLSYEPGGFAARSGISTPRAGLCIDTQPQLGTASRVFRAGHADASAGPRPPRRQRGRPSPSCCRSRGCAQFDDRQIAPKTAAHPVDQLPRGRGAARRSANISPTGCSTPRGDRRESTTSSVPSRSTWFMLVDAP